MRTVKDRRWVIAVAMLGFLAMLFLFAQELRLAPLQTLLQIWGVAALSDPFMDLYGVVAWFDLRASGADPTSTTTFIHLPSGEIVPSLSMNYPSTVFVLAWLGLSSQTILFWGLGLMFFYGLCIILLAGKCSMVQAMVWSAFALSPISILLMERANLDSLIFILVAGAMLCFPRYLTSVFFILSGTLLKIFPVLVLPAYFFKPSPKLFLAGGIVTAGSALILFSIRNELPMISAGLTHAYSTCFGVPVIHNLLVHGELLSLETGRLLIYWLVAGGLFIAGAGIALGGGMAFRSTLGRLEDRQQFGIIAGTAIFCASFFTGPQMDYKWCFLLLALPGVLRWTAEGGWLKKLSCTWIVLALLYSYWTLFSGEVSLRNALLKQFIAWMLYGASCVVFGFSFFQQWSAWWKNR